MTTVALHSLSRLSASEGVNPKVQKFWQRLKVPAQLSLLIYQSIECSPSVPGLRASAWPWLRVWPDLDLGLSALLFGLCCLLWQKVVVFSTNVYCIQKPVYQPVPLAKKNRGPQVTRSLPFNRDGLWDQRQLGTHWKCSQHSPSYPNSHLTAMHGSVEWCEVVQIGRAHV